MLRRGWRADLRCGMQVVESTGIVVTPYLEYPQLLGVLLRMLNESAPSVRHEVLKAYPSTCCY